MDRPKYIYDIDALPPSKYLILYGLQWAIVMFPALIIVAALGTKALQLSAAGEVRFFQLTLLTTGFFTAVQGLWGHRYPVLEGPATALLLTFIVLAPYGIESVQGGAIIGSLFLILIILSGKLKRAITLATPNVVGVILLLIALTLLPYLMRSVAGIDALHPRGRPSVFFFCIALILLMAAFAHRATGFLKTISLLLGMAVGTMALLIFEPPSLQGLSAAGWLSFPSDPIPSRPRFFPPAALAYAASYVAVMVNSLGSIHGIANITDESRLPKALSRGLFVNGIEGVCCGLMGIVGMVSYSLSPGVVLANRVASRFATVCCGAILVLAAFVPKLAALLAMVPAAVVGAALCVAMGAQIGAALTIISSEGLTSRDYYVVGLPLLLGTLVGLLPETFMAAVPTTLRVFVGNGVVFGIFLVILLEHVVLKKK